MRKFFTYPIDWLILIIPVILTAVGIVTIYTITYSSNGTRLAVDQLIYSILGIMVMSILMFVNYKVIFSVSPYLYIFGIILLLVLIPPLSSLPFILNIYGASRWIDLGFFQLQPSEIFKLIAILVASRLIADYVNILNYWRSLIYLLLMAFPVGLIILQPDLGTASLLVIIVVSVFFAAKPNRVIVVTGLLLALISVPIAWNNLRDYQKSRIETFLSPLSDPQGEGYNALQSLIAVGSGGLWGRGFGQGSQTVLNFLPVPHADFIFAGFAEATGLIGSSAIIFLYLLMIWRIIDLSRDASDPAAYLICIGIAVKFLAQMSIHILMNIGLMPVTGIPLPFVSYGGTALIVDFACIGIVQSISIRNKKALFGR